MNEAVIRDLMERYRELLPDDPLFSDALHSVEVALGVVLPRDLKVISAVYDGGTFGAMPNYHLRPTSWGYDVVHVTLGLRESIGFPQRYILLVELDESIVYMKTMETEEEPTPIYWIATPRPEFFQHGEPLPRDLVRPFHNFTEYFAFLVAEEEDERGWDDEDLTL